MIETAPRIAVLLPCYNEAAAIAQTIADFRAALPEAAIYVYDNNSSDATCEIAAAAGAIVRSERMQGKGNVVRRMFADVDADIYVMADGDATYEAAAAPALVNPSPAAPSTGNSRAGSRNATPVRSLKV